MSDERSGQIAESALRDTIRRFEDTGSPVITDGEQAKSSFATYPLDGATGLAFDGIVIPFEDGHTRQLPQLTTGPFRYATYASTYLAAAKRLTSLPVKQAVISASALSLLYPRPASTGIRARRSSPIWSTKRRPTSVNASSKAPTASRSTSPKGGCP